MNSNFRSKMNQVLKSKITWDSQSVFCKRAVQSHFVTEAARTISTDDWVWLDIIFDIYRLISGRVDSVVALSSWGHKFEPQGDHSTKHTFCHDPFDEGRYEKTNHPIKPLHREYTYLTYTYKIDIIYKQPKRKKLELDSRTLREALRSRYPAE